MRRFGAALLGVLIMTAPNINTGGLDLPAAIAEVPLSPVIARTGIVSDIVESDNITVKISGSNVLVQASYLFPQYQPLLGDIVYVAKQDAQWMVLGTMSGPVNSLLLNPSFEQGTTGAVPTDWTFVNGSVAAGTPTFQKRLGTNPLMGSNVGHLSLSPTGIGQSDSAITSARIDAIPGDRFTGGVYVYIIDLAGPNQMLFSTMVRFYDSAGVSITAASLGAVYNFAAPIGWNFLRPDSTSTAVTAPANTDSAALEIQVLFTVSDAATLFDAYLDGAILRKV
jgi:hypothetical protein